MYVKLVSCVILISVVTVKEYLLKIFPIWWYCLDFYDVIKQTRSWYKVLKFPKIIWISDARGARAPLRKTTPLDKAIEIVYRSWKAFYDQ